MDYTREDDDFDVVSETKENRKKPYELSKIEPIEPVPEDDDSRMNNELRILDADVLGIQYIPNIAGTPQAAVPANPATYAYFQKLNDENDHKRNLKE